ncbi:hypothetical protein OJAV_G00220090 [Oryzias javanicus]|uniref:Uncharacterized protein n=1 Tax=Oryzias javanicus TaxID=123683 RepID=A0A3S2LYB6_ORYJA|nr:hypothetical protein OJAV_G00220090 [Oryzias javanicus]
MSPHETVARAGSTALRRAQQQQQQQQQQARAYAAPHSGNAQPRGHTHLSAPRSRGGSPRGTTQASSLPQSVNSRLRWARNASPNHRSSRPITVFFKEIQIIFDASYSQIAWISSIMLAVMYAAGPISSIMVNTYGCRPIVMMGGCLCAVGMISASFCTNVLQLYMCIGVIGGLGLAFNLQPALTMIGKYFFKKRPIANGLAMAGSPVFLSTLAPLNQYLFNQFGWRGSFLILGGLLLNCCVAGSLMRPLGPPLARSRRTSRCRP